MDPDEKTLWNKKYSQGSHASLEPELFLVHAYSRFLASRSPGDALDIAGGAGRHALWLAQRGWNVKVIDVSEAGIALARENAREFLPQATTPGRNGRIETQLADLNSVRDLGQEEYDLVLVFFFLQRELFPAIQAALRPGGFLIYKTYTTEQERLGGGPRDPHYLLRPGELQQAFQSLQLLHYQESVASIAAAELVAQKLPAAS